MSPGLVGTVGLRLGQLQGGWGLSPKIGKTAQDRERDQEQSLDPAQVVHGHAWVCQLGPKSAFSGRGPGGRSGACGWCLQQEAGQPPSSACW